MDHRRKYPWSCLLAVVALLFVASFQPVFAQTAPSLGAASTFSVLGRTNVTCTAPGVITGDVGVYPGTFTNTTGCVIAGSIPPATNAAANLALTSFLNAYDALQLTPCTRTIFDAAFTGNVPALGPLPPGVYCFPAAVTFTNTTLTLDGSTNPNGIWIFKVGAALTGSGFQVVTINGANPCNVFWAIGGAVTLSTSTLPPVFEGNILAGAPVGGSVTITGGSVVGRVLANVAVTMTGTNIHGTCAVAAQTNGNCNANCNCKHHHNMDKDKDCDKNKNCDKDKDKDRDRDRDKNKDKDKDHKGHSH